MLSTCPGAEPAGPFDITSASAHGNHLRRSGVHTGVRKTLVITRVFHRRYSIGELCLVAIASLPVGFMATARIGATSNVCLRLSMTNSSCSGLPPHLGSGRPSSCKLGRPMADQAMMVQLSLTEFACTNSCSFSGNSSADPSVGIEGSGTKAPPSTLSNMKSSCAS